MHEFSRYPAANLGAEYLAMGFLMRRNIMAYKPPPNNEGKDIIRIHPDPRKSTKRIRGQVKSRIATDSDKGVLVGPKTVEAFDYLMVIHLNMGYFLRMAKIHAFREGDSPSEFLVVPRDVARKPFAPDSQWGMYQLVDHLY